MKKIIYILLIVTIFVLSGCSNKSDQMADFIPTTAPSEDVNTNASPTDSAVTLAPKSVHVGQTTTKYVKLTKYGDQLNVRSTPSTDGDIIGFLVHAEKIKVIEVDNGWASFVYHDVVCYVNADFLVDKKPTYLQPPTLTPVPKGDSSGSVNPDI